MSNSLIRQLHEILKVLAGILLYVLLTYLLSFIYNPLTSYFLKVGYDVVPWINFVDYLRFFLGVNASYSKIFFYLSVVLPFWILATVVTFYFSNDKFIRIVGFVVFLSLLIVGTGMYTTLGVLLVALNLGINFLFEKAQE